MSSVGNAVAKRKGRKKGSQDFVYIDKEFARKIIEKLNSHVLDKNLSVSRAWLEDGGFELVEVCSNRKISQEEKEWGYEPAYRYAKDQKNFSRDDKDVELHDHPHDSSVRRAGEAEARRFSFENLKSVCSASMPKTKEEREQLKKDGIKIDDKRGHQKGTTDAFVPMSAIKRIIQDQDIYDQATKIFPALADMCQKWHEEEPRKVSPDSWKSLSLGDLRPQLIEALKRFNDLSTLIETGQVSVESLLERVVRTKKAMIKPDVPEGVKAESKLYQGEALVAGAGLYGYVNSAALLSRLQKVDLRIMNAFIKATDGMGDSVPLVVVRGFINQRRKVSRSGVQVRWRWLETRMPHGDNQGRGGAEGFKRVESPAASKNLVPDLRLAYNVDEQKVDWSDFLKPLGYGWVFKPEFSMHPAGAVSRRTKVVETQTERIRKKLR